MGGVAQAEEAALTTLEVAREGLGSSAGRDHHEEGGTVAMSRLTYPQRLAVGLLALSLVLWYCWDSAHQLDRMESEIYPTPSYSPFVVATKLAVTRP